MAEWTTARPPSEPCMRPCTSASPPLTPPTCRASDTTGSWSRWPSPTAATGDRGDEARCPARSQRRAAWHQRPTGVREGACENGLKRLGLEATGLQPACFTTFRARASRRQQIRGGPGIGARRRACGTSRGPIHGPARRGGGQLGRGRRGHGGGVVARPPGGPPRCRFPLTFGDSPCTVGHDPLQPPRPGWLALMFHHVPSESVEAPADPGWAGDWRPQACLRHVKGANPRTGPEMLAHRRSQPRAGEIRGLAQGSRGGPCRLVRSSNRRGGVAAPPSIFSREESTSGPERATSYTRGSRWLEPDTGRVVSRRSAPGAAAPCGRQARSWSFLRDHRGGRHARGGRR